VAQKPHVLLQIRTGDALFGGGVRLLTKQASVAHQGRFGGDLGSIGSGLDLARYEGFAKCAIDFAHSNEPIYLMSDSIELRTHLQKVYPGRILTHNDPEQGPTLWWQNYSSSAILGVAGEQYVASKCHKFVITSRSGLGMQSVFIHGNVNENNIRVLPGCNSTGLKHLSRMYSQI
jgi:hypothetical protein